MAHDPGQLLIDPVDPQPDFEPDDRADFPTEPAPAPFRPDLPRPAHPVTFGRVGFAHPAEDEFARLLDFYRVAWDYEPTSFPLNWDGDRVTEMFTPDFYLPEQDLYVELTTMKQSLIQRKHRKLRRIREVYPEINIVLLTRRDYYELLSRFGYGAVDISSLPEEDIERILYSPAEIAARVEALGAQISADYAGRSILLVGLLKGVTFFLADLARAITRPVAIDYLSVASLQGGAEADDGSRVHFSKDADFDLAGQHVLLLEDIVNTGLTLDFVITRLWERRPASLEVCVLFDKRERRLIDAPIKYTGFTIPNAYVVGYGLDYRERYRNLPFLCVLKQDVFHRDHGPRLAAINSVGHEAPATAKLVNAAANERRAGS
jgi:hypoxanthine phosphoribosyltransferase